MHVTNVHRGDPASARVFVSVPIGGGLETTAKRIITEFSAMSRDFRARLRPSEILPDVGELCVFSFRGRCGGHVVVVSTSLHHEDAARIVPKNHRPTIMRDDGEAL